MMNIEQEISNYEPDVKTSSFRIRCSKFDILKAPVHLAPQDNYVSPLPSRDCVAVGHPGQVPQSGTRAGIHNNLIILNSNWIPDLARLRRTRPE